MIVRTVIGGDAARLAQIYNHYIENSHSTFETEPIDEAEMRSRIDEGRTGSYPFLVAEDNLDVLGYAYAHQYRVRSAYRATAEVSIYLAPDSIAQGIGSSLYERLFEQLITGKFHTVVAGISLPNDASIKLHEKFGMQKVAHFYEVGRKFGRWIDVGYWQRALGDKVLPSLMAGC
jgi:L-amino acid N-acyltransferase YncA